MLLSTSPRRLVLLATVLSILVLMSVRRNSYVDHLPNGQGAGLSLIHDGKGKEGRDQSNGRTSFSSDGVLHAAQHRADKVLQQSDVDSLGPGHESGYGTLASDEENNDSSGLNYAGSTYWHKLPTLGKPKASPLPHEPLARIKSKIQELRVKWAPPAISGHWPPYDWYGDKDYDPNLWEGFEWNDDYYIKNGVKKLMEGKRSVTTPLPYLPYPLYNSEQWKSQWRGDYVSCEGARGRLLNESHEDWVLAYFALPEGFPRPSIGAADVLGLDIDHCFDRYHRFGPYGHGQNADKPVYGWERPTAMPDWPSVRWGQLQDQCLLANQERYRPGVGQRTSIQSEHNIPYDASELPDDPEPQGAAPHYHHRTALVIRAWEGYYYTDNDMEAIRALITEVSLLSGGEYQVLLLVNIKNAKADLSDRKLYQELLAKSVPAEFHSISILWNEKILQKWYPKVGDWQVYWHQFMVLQWFSKMYPQFDYVWNWETDARYTGSHYRFLEQVASFAKAVPRKYLWERNQRFYIPAVHGTYEQFLADADATIEAAVGAGTMNVVWGPQRYNTTIEAQIGPEPPCAVEDDDFDWGVGENADLITLQPIWDPTHTDWVYRDKIFNYLPGIRPQFSAQDPLDEKFTHPEFVNIPRRTYINTVSRFSKRQLHAMHVENREGRTMQAEMWPATVALHHGLKAVYAPHPIWTDRKWPGWYMDSVFNADGGEPARWSAWKDSVYSHDREHNFAGWSWYYSTEFPRTLYHRWLGWGAKVGSKEQYPNNPLRSLGGHDFEEYGVAIDLSDRTPDVTPISAIDDGLSGKGIQLVGGHGRMCLPPMLLHPVKRVSADTWT